MHLFAIFFSLAIIVLIWYRYKYIMEDLITPYPGVPYLFSIYTYVIYHTHIEEYFK